MSEPKAWSDWTRCFSVRGHKCFLADIWRHDGFRFFRGHSVDQQWHGRGHGVCRGRRRQRRERPKRQEQRGQSDAEDVKQRHFVKVRVASCVLKLAFISSLQPAFSVNSGLPTASGYHARDPARLKLRRYPTRPSPLKYFRTSS